MSHGPQLRNCKALRPQDRSKLYTARRLNACTVTQDKPTSVPRPLNVYALASLNNACQCRAIAGLPSTLQEGPHRRVNPPKIWAMGHETATARVVVLDGDTAYV